MKNKYIYHLKAIELKQRKRSFTIKKNKNGSITATECDLGCYSSYYSAEKAIKKHLDRTFDYLIYGGFIIYKKKLDDLNNIGWKYNNYYSIKTYDRKGNYNSFSFSDSKSYKGTNEKYLKFNSGDIVYYYTDGELIPCIIIWKPFNKEKWRKTFPKTCSGDYSDDCYLAMSQQGHCHIHTPLAFPFFGKLSKKEKNGIIKEAKIYFGEQYQRDRIDQILNEL